MSQIKTSQKKNTLGEPWKRGKVELEMKPVPENNTERMMRKNYTHDVNFIKCVHFVINLCFLHTCDIIFIWAVCKVRVTLDSSTIKWEFYYTPSRPTI